MCDKKDIHPIEPNLALVCFILNILLGPIGTWIHAFMGPNPGRGIIIGILQAVLIPFFLVGYIWAIVYGLRIYQVSLNNSLKNGGGFIQHQ